LGELVEGVGCLGVFCDIWKGVIGVLCFDLQLSKFLFRPLPSVC